MTIDLGLTATPIESTADVEALRTIRNACREGFAHDNAFISENVQRAWWVAMRGRVKGWLYWREIKMEPGGIHAMQPSWLVGYGLLRQTEDGRWWTSIAVLPQYAGRGYGKAIMADTIRRHNGTVWSEARLDNPAAMKIHPPDDWLLLGQDERIAHFKTFPEVHAHGETRRADAPHADDAQASSDAEEAAEEEVASSAD